MSTIPTKITQEDFDYHIRPCLSTAKRGYESKVPLFKIFNYILYRLHTGCQWHQLPLAPDPHDPEKSEISYHAVYYPFTTIFASGAWMGASKPCGNSAF